jgi:hypothetical protein
MFRSAFLLLLAATAISAQEMMIRETFDAKTDTHVEITALFSKPAPGGYFPVRVKIANNLNSERSIRLNFECRGGYYSPGITSSSNYGFTAPAGKTVTRDIYVPTAPGGDGGNSSIVVNLTGSLGTASHAISSGFSPAQPVVLLSEALFTPNASTLDSQASSRFSSSGYRSSSEFAARFDPKQTPDDWRAYAGYDSILMTDGDWGNVPPGARNAILAWVRLGGQLAIHTATGAALSTLGLPAEPSFGEIVITPINTTNSLDASKTLDLVSKRRTDPRQESIQSDFDGGWPLQNTFGTRGFHYGLFIFVLIAFGIMVGPVNLFVFAKSGRRHKLFITTPIISLVASLLLIGMIILQDGLGGNGSRVVLMEVRPDGGQNAAYLHQEQFCRTGVLTGTRFTVDTPCVINPVPIAGSRWARFTNNYDTAGTFNLQPDGGSLAASGDWFQSRSEHGHFINAVIPTRGRIEATGDPTILVSTFEFPIETFYYLDPAGQWHRAEKIQPGKRFTLTAVDASMVDPTLKKTSLNFTKRLRSQLNHLAKRPGHYIAITTEAPAIDTLPGINWDKTETIITGPVL